MNIIYTEEQRIQVLYITDRRLPLKKIQGVHSQDGGRRRSMSRRLIEKLSTFSRSSFYSTLTIARQYHEIVEVTWLSVIATK
jgi:hypothetical protein